MISLPVLLFLICSLLQSLPISLGSLEIREKERGSAQERENEREREECNLNAFVTFVMPTSGSRQTITQAIESLRRSHDCHWRLIIVYSIPSYSLQETVLTKIPSLSLSRYTHQFISDPRISYLPFKRTSMFNYGGSSRNIAFQYISTSWIAFLDDDDQISQDYITQLKNSTVSYPSADAVVFRMSCKRCYNPLLPPETHNSLKAGYVGISYAVKRAIVIPLGEYQFENGPEEDYKLLHDILLSNCLPPPQLKPARISHIPSPHHVLLSSAVTYYVKGWNYVSESNFNPNIVIQSALLNDTSPSCEGDSALTSWKWTQVYYRPYDMDFPEERDDRMDGDQEKGREVDSNGRYHRHIRGLKESFVQAIQTDCLDYHLFKKFVKIEFHFGPLARIRNSDKLLIQMDVLSLPFSTLESSHITRYVQKLQIAAQVWTYSPSRFRYLTERLNLTNVYLVPMWHILDTGAHKYNLRERESHPCSRLIVKQMSRGQSNPSPCLLFPSHCSPPSSTKIPLCPRPSVVYFTVFEENGNKIKQIGSHSAITNCDILLNSIDDIICFEGAKGNHLDTILNSVTIVILSGLIRPTLESHLPDYFLWNRKIVISTHSFGLNSLFLLDLSSSDPELDLIYGPIVQFVDSFNDIPPIVKKYLVDDSLRLQQVEKGIQFLHEQRSSSEAICEPLRALLHSTIAH